MDRLATSDVTTGERTIYTVCNSHCGGSCILKVYVKGDRVSRIETDDTNEPQFRACLKGRAYRQRIYHPDRILYPLQRVGDRGEGKFERISWHDAIDRIAVELTKVRDKYGPASILFTFSGADYHFLHNMTPIYKLLVKFGGCTGPWGFISNEAAQFATLVSYGTDKNQNTRDDLLNSRLIILWGFNPADTVQSTNTTWYLAQAREAGAKIISVDPRYTNTATLCHQWIPIRPATDTAMLIAMAYVMIKEGIHDEKFLEKYTIGFEKFESYVLGTTDGVAKTPSWAEEHTGVPAEFIAGLARDYATIKPGALIPGFGPGRTAYGEQFHRAAIALACMTGNIGVHGGEPAAFADQGEFWGGDLPYKVKTSGRMRTGGNPVDFAAPSREKILKARGNIANSSARVNSAKYADAILQGRSGGYFADYHLLYMMNANYVNQIPNTKRTVEAFQKLDFFVLQEQFMTATAKLADIILPVCTFLERNDFSTGGATPFFGAVSKAVEPLGESKSQFDIALALAERLGMTDYNDKSEEEWLREIVKGYSEVWGIPSYEDIKNHGPYKLNLGEPHIAFRKQIEDLENNPFPTPSGKIEIYSQEMADWEDPLMPPIPTYIEPWEGTIDQLALKYPLQLVTSHFLRRAHSQFDNLPWLAELQPQTVTINPVDAKYRGISNGSLVTLFNDRGVITIPALVSERIMPGVVDLPQGAWYQPDSNGIDRGGCANVLVKDQSSPRNSVNTNSCLVQVEKQ